MVRVHGSKKQEEPKDQFQEIKEKFPSLFENTPSNYFESLKEIKDAKEIENLLDETILLDNLLQQIVIFKKKVPEIPNVKKMGKDEKKEEKKEEKMEETRVEPFDVTEELKEPEVSKKERKRLNMEKNKQERMEAKKRKEENKKKQLELINQQKEEKKQREKLIKEKEIEKQKEVEKRKREILEASVKKPKFENISKPVQEQPMVFQPLKFSNGISNLNSNSKITSSFFKTLITQVAQNKLKFKKTETNEISENLEVLQKILESDDVNVKRNELVHVCQKIVGKCVFELYGIKDLNNYSSFDQIPQSLLTIEIRHFLNLGKMEVLNDVDVYSIIVIVLKIINSLNKVLR